MCLAHQEHPDSLACATGIMSAQIVSEGKWTVSTFCCPKPRLSVCDATQLKGSWEADLVYQPVIAGGVLADSKGKGWSGLTVFECYRTIEIGKEDYSGAFVESVWVRHETQTRREGGEGKWS